MINLPKFLVIKVNQEIEYWEIMAARLTYKEAIKKLQDYRSRGYSNLYLVGMTYIVGPGDDV